MSSCFSDAGVHVVWDASVFSPRFIHGCLLFPILGYVFLSQAAKLTWQQGQTSTSLLAVIKGKALGRVRGYIRPCHNGILGTRPPSLVLCIQLPEGTEDLACLFLAVPFLLPPVSLPGVTGISAKKPVRKYSYIFHYVILRTKQLPPLQNVAASGLDANGSSMPSMKYPVPLLPSKHQLPLGGAFKGTASTLLV